MINADFLIIGAGVIGCAIAKKIKELYPKDFVVVLEKNEAPGLETSQFNSGVIHSGIHLNPSFLKAKLAREGGQLIIDHCKLHGIPYRQSGMYILVSGSDVIHLGGQLPSFIKLLKRAKIQGIDREILFSYEIKRREPALKAVFGINLKQVYVIDPVAFVKSLYSSSAKSGVLYEFNTEVTGARIIGNRWHVDALNDSYTAKCVINAAGLNAESISKLAGFDCPKVHYYRGEYYEVTSSKADLVNTLVYPVTRPGSPGLGIHLTKTLGGKLLLGPNATRLIGDKDKNRTPSNHFWRAVQPFFPSLRLDEICWSFSGVRTKLSAGKGESDFYIRLENRDNPWINLIGIESPGLTSSMAIANYVCRILN
ncbi:MAG: NAD(P)/FAD-dependent oxidoreductase [bacterium]|nr:NAD(P)/FAD-dependent oxidoreductase [bacterium]